MPGGFGLVEHPVYAVAGGTVGRQQTNGLARLASQQGRGQRGQNREPVVLRIGLLRIPTDRFWPEQDRSLSVRDPIG